MKAANGRLATRWRLRVRVKRVSVDEGEREEAHLTPLLPLLSGGRRSSVLSLSWSLSACRFFMRTDARTMDPELIPSTCTNAFEHKDGYVCPILGFAAKNILFKPGYDDF